MSKCGFATLLVPPRGAAGKAGLGALISKCGFANLLIPPRGAAGKAGLGALSTLSVPWRSLSAMPSFHNVAGAPDPVAPFSHAVEADGWVHLTGQMPFRGTSVDSGYPDGIEAQTHQVMKNLETVLEGIGLGLADVLQVRIYLTHFERDYPAMNAAYASWWPADRRPARTCIGVTALARGALVEIDMVARRGA